MTPSKKSLGVALAGCGRFGDFCLSAAGDLPQLLPVGVTDTDPARALATAGLPRVARAQQGKAGFWTSDNDVAPVRSHPIRRGLDMPHVDAVGRLDA